VLALPAEARGFRQRLLHHRRRIAEDLHPDIAPGRQEAPEFLQFALQDFVIITPLRVGRDGAPIAAGQEREGIILRPVAHREDGDAAPPRPEAGRAGALVRPLLHPRHGAVGPFREPAREALGQGRNPVGPGDTQAAEAEVPGPVLDQPAQVSAVIDAVPAQKSRSA